MRTAILALAVLLLVCVSVASASIVIHDGQLGIVAEATPNVLDSNGHVWCFVGPSWERTPAFDPPVPTSQIRFWGWSMFITTDDEAYWINAGNPEQGWVLVGTWPASSVETDGETSRPTMKARPNPMSESCRVSFSITQPGPVTVQLFDASGRLVRQLHDGPMPAGGFSLTWDGRDDVGNALPSAVYFAKITTPEGEQTAKVVLTR